jgi:NhaA family Na+:H+ antiporter
LFYSGTLHLAYLGAAAGLVGVLALLNYARVYRIAPYLIVGGLLWFCVHGAGIDATLAGVLLALFIPTRPPANLNALVTQASAIVETEAQHQGKVLRHGPSLPALRALDSIHDRLESPADRMLRQVAPRSSYVVLPLFALANAGVVLSSHALSGRGSLILAIMCALVIGKPAGLVIASVLAVRLGLATKPEEYSWRQLAGAGALAGIGFTMSLFIATQALPDPADFAAAKIAVFAGSMLSAVVAVAILWSADRQTRHVVAAPEMMNATDESRQLTHRVTLQGSA